MLRSTCRKGMILLQTLVMTVIFSMISVMVMQWVLGRYMIAARTYRSSVTKVHSQGYFFNLFSTWKDDLGSIPSGGNTLIDTQYVSYTARGSGNNMRTVTITSDEDR